MKVVYLHGVGPDGDAKREWLAALNQSLTELGADGVDEDDVIAPRYAALLGAQGISVKAPERTYSQKNDRAARRAFERRQAQVERTIRQFEDIRTFGFHRAPGAAINGAQNLLLDNPPIGALKQVRNYVSDEGTRNAVLQHILDHLPISGEIILVGHSLGSVVAIDLLDNLPPEIHVRRFITIGSPAGSEGLHKASGRMLKQFPYRRVDDWSNFFDPADVVTAGRGLAEIFPGAQDFAITGAGLHYSSSYLRHPAIATLVDQTLNPGTDLVPSSNSIALSLTTEQATTLATLEFANQVAVNIKDTDKADRFEDAVNVLRDSYAAELKAAHPGQTLPVEIDDLAAGRMPSLPRRWNLAEAVAMTVVLANTNLIAPHEIEVDDAALDAIPAFLTSLGFTSGTAKKVRAAIVEVNDHLATSRWTPNVKTRVAMAAVGVAILAAGPVGIAMAGAAGTAGAAAITSGLAAFGPGGMAGGMAMLTGLGATGGMVAAASTTARTGGPSLILDPTSLAIRVATAQALNSVGEDFDTSLWQDVALAITQGAAENNRLETFSDPGSPTIKKNDAILKMLRDLQDYMRKRGLVPEPVVAALTDGVTPTAAGAPANLRSRLRLPGGK